MLNVSVERYAYSIFSKKNIEIILIGILNVQFDIELSWILFPKCSLLMWSATILNLKEGTIKHFEISVSYRNIIENFYEKRQHWRCDG